MIELPVAHAISEFVVVVVAVDSIATTVFSLSVVNIAIVTVSRRRPAMLHHYQSNTHRYDAILIYIDSKIILAPKNFDSIFVVIVSRDLKFNLLEF